MKSGKSRQRLRVHYRSDFSFIYILVNLARIEKVMRGIMKPNLSKDVKRDKEECFGTPA